MCYQGDVLDICVSVFPKNILQVFRKKNVFLLTYLELLSRPTETTKHMKLLASDKEFRRKNIGGVGKGGQMQRRDFKEMRPKCLTSKSCWENVKQVHSCVSSPRVCAFRFYLSFPQWSPLPSLTHLSCPHIPL